MVCHVSPDGMAVQTPDDRNAMSSTASWAASLCVSFPQADRVVPILRVWKAAPAAAGVRAQVSALWTRLGWSGPAPATRPVLSPGCTLGPRTCPPWKLGGLHHSGPRGGPRASPGLPLGLGCFSGVVPESVQHSPGTHALHLGIPGWAPREADPRWH